MSHEGKIARGKKWYSNRNLDGDLPDDITKDPGKMCDVDYYLEEEKKINEANSKSKKKGV